MVDRHAAHIFHARLRRDRLEVIGTRDLAVGVGGDRKFPGTVFRIRRKRVEPLDAVGRHADDGGAGRIELVLPGREGVRFEIAAAGESRRVEIHHDRPFLQGLPEGKGEMLAGQAGLGGEVGGRGTRFERGKSRHRQSRRHQRRRCYRSHKTFFHFRDPREGHRPGPEHLRASVRCPLNIDLPRYARQPTPKFFAAHLPIVTSPARGGSGCGPAPQPSSRRKASTASRGWRPRRSWWAPIRSTRCWNGCQPGCPHA